MSFENYIYRAKAEHIEHTLPGYVAWTTDLDRAFKEAIRCVNRRAGASRQSKPIDVIAVAKLEMVEEPLVVDGPIGPVDMSISGTMFLLREFELSS